MSSDDFLQGLSANDIERAFVDAHWRYGGLIHQRTAEALVGALAAETDADVRHMLFSRLFAEFAGSLETYAAWAWGVRNRSKYGLFLNAYLQYRNSDVGEFYRLTRCHDSDLSDLLGLPSADRIVELALSRCAELPAEGYRKSLDANYNRLREAAGLYFANDRLVIDTYNKTKHGAPIVRLFEPEDDRKFEIILDIRNPPPEDPRPYRFPAFTVHNAEIAKQLSDIRVMTDSIQELASLTKVLLDAGVLYEEHGIERPDVAYNDDSSAHGSQR